MIRSIRFGRFGLKEDPTGQIVVDRQGKLYDVTGVYYRQLPACFMLRVRYFNGEAAPDIAASAVKLVLPDPEDFSSEEEPSEDELIDRAVERADRIAEDMSYDRRAR